MEASALPASVGLARPRIAIGTSLLRLRSDEQLVALFREGNEDAFRMIHDRYRARLLAYARQMLSASGQDYEDALQEIYVRAYYGLRANHRDLALRPWLYRIAHNRCVDVLRRHLAVPVDCVQASSPDQQDPATRAEQRDALRRLIADVRRLPEQQRSALLMRELSGMSYTDVAGALSVSVPAVKSLLVRARVGLAAASEARNTACAQIREDLILAHDRGVRASGLARRHMHECQGCREFRSEVRGVSRQLAGLAPTLGPIGVIANLLGFGGGGGGAAAGGSMAGGGAAAASGAAGTGAGASAGLLAGGAGHVVTLLAAAVVTAGGAVEIQRTFTGPAGHRVHHHAARVDTDLRPAGAPTAAQAPGPASIAAGPFGAPPATSTPATATNASADPAGSWTALPARRSASRSVPISQSLDPDQLLYNVTNPAGISTGPESTPAGGPTTGSGTGMPLPPGTSASPGTTPGPTGASPSAPVGTGTPSGTGVPTVTGTPGDTGTQVGGTPTAGPPTAGSGSAAAPGAGTNGTSGGSTSAPGASATSTPTGAARTNPPTVVSRTIGAGAAGGGRVVTFVTSKHHTHHHGFALGTLLAR